MYAEERQQHILDRARAAGRVEVNTLAEALDVTPETVRRDLTILERYGVLRRVHGGAIPVERLGFEPGVETRAERFVAEKERIAKGAVDEGSVLRRVHGGAIPVERLGFEPGVETRAERFVAEKERIAKAALEHLPDEGTVLLDAGTSTMRLAERLPRDHELTIVTNSLGLATVIAQQIR